MRKADFAETILSLTTTPERAVATAGDLAEDADARGTFWFWTSLMKATASLVWREFVDRPRRLASPVFVAFLLQLGMLVTLTLLVGVASIVALAISLGSRLPQIDIGAGELRIESGAALIMVATVLGLLACQSLVGKWLALNAAGRALPACIAYAAFTQVAWTLVSPWVPGPHHPFDPIVASLLTILEWTVLFAGLYRGTKGSKNVRASSYPQGV